ncbi:hypothetical protein QBC35DRAFT_509084 [Podospora australis]|uniref:F-box domain-containing protein n=1 Tax=Podospora australis TaxID=1536484 RepID=A0AAN6WIW2_9PEZI|nr:hypothetical protein QBC35DRAFT_509084 [Podospora australis]
MDINGIPTEVLSLILGYLLVPEGEQHAKRGTTQDFQDLRAARLVCQQWNQLASRHMFRTLALLHHPDHDSEFEKWTEMTSSPMIQEITQRVEIYSGPHHFGSVAEMSEWSHEEHWDEFTAAVDRIAELPNLSAVHIRFSDKCIGDPDGTNWPDEEAEEPEARLEILNAVFDAIDKRKTKIEARKNDSKASYSTITSLTIENLQNKPIPEFISSDVFQSVLQDITELRLLVTNEYNEHGPDHDLYLPERCDFEPWLQTKFLPCFADRLTSLHLAFGENWGVAPGYFDGKGLLFPRLKSLTLGEFVIGHHDQFDWVLAHTTLETLRLHDCVIASYLTFQEDQGSTANDRKQLSLWGIRTHDWHRYPAWAFGQGETNATFRFDGTWEQVFDKIRTSLPKLADFRMENSSHRYGPHFNSTEEMRCSLTSLRYIVLDTGLLPSPWIKADNYTGALSFGNDDPEILPVEERAEPWHRRPGCELNRAQDTLKGDKRAFDELVSTVERRRRGRL